MKDLKIVFEGGPDGEKTKPMTAAEARQVIAACRKGESLYHAARRLSRQGEIRNLSPRENPKRILSAAGVRAALKKRGYLCGEGTVSEVEAAVGMLIDFAVHNARSDKRRTIKPGDVNGNTALRVEGSRSARRKR